MPWGHPDTVEPLYCPPCGRSGTDWMQRRRLTGPGPLRWVRVCPPCWHLGWHLVGPAEVGVFWWRRLAAALARQGDSDG